MKMHIIDGYNVIYSISLFKQYLENSESGLEKCREELIRLCKEKFGRYFLLVFDGKVGGRAPESSSTIFTTEGVKADEVIVELVTRYAREDNEVYVYSRDRSLMDRCKIRGAIPADPEAVFKARKERIVGSKAERGSKSTNSLKKYDWQKEFGLKKEKKNERIR